MSIQPYQPAAEVEVFAPQDQAVRRLTEWAQSAIAAHQVAESLVRTSFVPEGFRGKPHEATAAILSGLEVGLSPMASLRSFDVIQGTAAPRAVTLRAIVQSKGHDIDLIESTATRCVMEGTRKGSSRPQRVTWTIDRAKQLGLVGKSNWKNQPQAMLLARATSEVCRLIAADAILGIAYTSEEIADGGTVEQATSTQTVETATSGTRRMSRRAGPVEPDPQTGDGEGSQAETSVAEGEAGSNPAGNPSPSSPSDAQRGLMFASFKDAGFTTDARTAEGRAARLDYIGNVIGRTIESSNDLTVDEMSQVIDSLKADADAETDPWKADQQ